MSNKRHRSTVLSLCALVLGMTLLAYASVPLYRIFCQVTGLGGTTQTAKAYPTRVLDRVMRVQFEASIDPNLPWEFTPGQREVTVKVGEEKIIFYNAKNTANHPITGRAVYNVVPHEAGAHFVKIECFCFQNQTLQPGQQVHMPVLFYIDPDVMEDPDMDRIRTITLSYTFFPSKS